jgi:ATP-binding cassette, subfamily C (CFTR/MRP), member 1
MIRGAMVNLIYARLLNVWSDSHDSGSAITLMTTDSDSVSGSGDLFHELWGYIVEVIVDMVMLSMNVK